MLESIFAPLDRRYCDYFYVMSVIPFMVGVLLFILSIMVYFFRKKGTINMFNMMLLIFTYFFIYFQNRLFYSMCYNSL